MTFSTKDLSFFILFFYYLNTKNIYEKKKEYKTNDFKEPAQSFSFSSATYIVLNIFVSFFYLFFYNVLYYYYIFFSCGSYVWTILAIDQSFEKSNGVFLYHSGEQIFWGQFTKFFILFFFFSFRYCQLWSKRFYPCQAPTCVSVNFGLKKKKSIHNKKTFIKSRKKCN